MLDPRHPRTIRIAALVAATVALATAPTASLAQSDPEGDIEEARAWTEQFSGLAGGFAGNLVDVVVEDWIKRGYVDPVLRAVESSRIAHDKCRLSGSSTSWSVRPGSDIADFTLAGTASCTRILDARRDGDLSTSGTTYTGPLELRGTAYPQSPDAYCSPFRPAWDECPRTKGRIQIVGYRDPGSIELENDPLGRFDFDYTLMNSGGTASTWDMTLAGSRGSGYHPANNVPTVTLTAKPAGIPFRCCPAGSSMSGFELDGVVEIFRW